MEELACDMSIGVPWTSAILWDERPVNWFSLVGLLWSHCFSIRIQMYSSIVLVCNNNKDNVCEMHYNDTHVNRKRSLINMVFRLQNHELC